MKITVFYIIYYTFLAGFFMLMLLAFFTTLYDEKPTWDASSNGIIGTNPGVGYRPMPPDERIESTLVWYRHGNRVGKSKLHSSFKLDNLMSMDIIVLDVASH